jgi:arginyl-tRNA synthetase
MTPRLGLDGGLISLCGRTGLGSSRGDRWQNRLPSGSVMDLFKRLAEATRRQNHDGDLPDFIVPLLLQVAENPTEFTGREDLVAQLLQRVQEYETWSEMCCEKQGFSLEDIHRTLDRLKVRY